MKLSKAMKLIAIMLLLIVCITVLADCHCDCCGNGCDGRPCCLACIHALVIGAYVVVFNLAACMDSSDYNFSTPHFAPVDIFQPPRSAV